MPTERVGNEDWALFIGRQLRCRRHSGRGAVQRHRNRVSSAGVGKDGLYCYIVHIHNYTYSLLEELAILRISKLSPREYNCRGSLHIGSNQLDRRYRKTSKNIFDPLEFTIHQLYTLSDRNLA